jgi:spore photoproduct lyase
MDSLVKKIVVEEGAEHYKLSESILKKLGHIPVAKGTHDDVSFKRDMQMDLDKETLRLIHFRGEFLKPCPGTKGYICCGYQILNVGTNCPIDCSYCILQAYFNKPSLRIYVNLEKELKNIGEIIDSHPEKIFRIGTGEFTDSLALDQLTGWSRSLSAFFSNKRNVVLELKTKTDNIDGLLSSPSRERIIVSWSLNSADISAREEHGAISIKKRLIAAKRCQEEGFIVGFHFDPLIHYRDWADGYLKTIELLDKYIDPQKVIWISMGCLRYIPELKFIIRKRHPDTHILDGEFVNSSDGKKRYFKPIRLEMYSLMKENLDKWQNDLGLYLCMESNDVWLSSFGWSPEDSKGLSDYLDKRVLKIYSN